MSGSKYAYVKGYELPDTILPNTYIVVRIDGRAFHRYEKKTLPSNGAYPHLSSLVCPKNIHL